MKDEYDFRGGVKGKFHRPGYRVHLPNTETAMQQAEKTAIQPAPEGAVTNFLHMICDEPYCTHALTLGISETVEEAIGRANDMMRGTRGAGQTKTRPGLVHVADMPDTPEATALNAAAALLGWRRETKPDGTRVVYCPDHTAGLECSYCRAHDCRCAPRPRFDVERR